jgi:DNA-directed RNA polymerase subunit beta
VPSGVEGIVTATEKFSRQMSLSEEERREFQKQLKEAESQGNLRVAEAFGAMVSELEKVLQKPLTAADGSPLVRDQDHKAVA